jgi:hypothetical protein
MELKIYSPQEAGFIQKIDWNFEELKAEITAAARDYETSVYTDDTIKAAKADRAKLNKFVDALNGKRTEIRKKLLEPDEQFGREVKELTGIVQKAIDNIDGQVKDYERRQREDKMAKIREFYEDNIYDLADILPFEKVMKSEYANASKSMKSIKEEILALIQKVSEGLAVINEVDSKFAGDMKAVFLRTYDLGAAMAERNRLEEEERRRMEYLARQEQIRAEREAREKAEAEKVMAAGRKQDKAQPEVSTRDSDVSTETMVETVEEPVNIVDFRVYATATQLGRLKTFLKAEGIRFEPVPKQ